MGLPEPRLDHWHTLRDLGRIGRAQERTAYRQLAAAERAARATAEAAASARPGRRPRRGLPVRGATDLGSVQAATAATEEAIARFDGAAWVLATVRANTLLR